MWFQGEVVCSLKTGLWPRKPRRHAGAPALIIKGFQRFQHTVRSHPICNNCRCELLPTNPAGSLPPQRRSSRDGRGQVGRTLAPGVIGAGPRGHVVLATRPRRGAGRRQERGVPSLPSAAGGGGWWWCASAWACLSAHTPARRPPPSPLAQSLRKSVCVYPALFITRSTGTLVNTPTNPDGGGRGRGGAGGVPARPP